MANTFAKLRALPKRATALVAIAAAVITVPAMLNAWGPDRPTYTIEKPADHVTFNSIVNNPNEGDERNFVRIKDTANTAANGWTDDVTVENGKEYWVRMYVHNNAADNLGLVAENVTAKFNVPTQTANRIQVDGYLSSSNARPTQVWDQAVFHGANNANFNLNYVPGSASYTTNALTSGVALPDSVVSSGATLGYDQLNGKIPGCFKYSGIVLFKVKAGTTTTELQKTVRVNGAADKTFKESVTAKPGEKVDYQIYFKNTGGVQQKDVVINDILPAGVTYVPGSSYLHNSGGTKQIADGVTTGGVIIGGYMPGGDAYLKFTAQVASADKLICGENKLINKATSTTETGKDEDTAEVVVPKECQPEQPKPIEVCRLEDKKIVTINEKDFDSKKHSKNVNDCKEVPTPKTTEVCRLSDKQIVTINENEFDEKKYSKNMADCKETPVVPTTTEVCRIEDKKIVTINEKEYDTSKYTQDMSRCNETPTPVPTPAPAAELPQTGASDSIVSLLGLGSIAAAAGYYLHSRRFLR